MRIDWPNAEMRANLWRERAEPDLCSRVDAVIGEIHALLDELDADPVRDARLAMADAHAQAVARRREGRTASRVPATIQRRAA